MLRLVRILGVATVTTALAVAAVIIKKMAEPDELDRPYVDGKGRVIDPTKPFWKRFGV